MNVKEEFSVRLRVAMAAAGMEISGTALEGAFNRKWHGAPVSVQAAWNWINAKTMPRQDKLQLLARLLRVDPYALQYGAPAPLTAAERRRSWDERLSFSERETLEAFLRLPTPQRLLVREVVLTFAKVYGKVEPMDE
jgi:transcriptional regulator with XRE-family HTH domain